MKSKFMVVLLIALFLTGCSAESENHIDGDFQPTEQSTPSSAGENHAEDDFQQAGLSAQNQTENNVEVELASIVCHSIEDLQAAVSSNKTSETISTMSLSTLDSIYYPTLDFDGYDLYQIEILPRYIIYYYMPASLSGEFFSYKNGITVTFKRTDGDLASSVSSDPMAPLVEQAGVPLTEENVLYEKDKNALTIPVGNTWMEVRVPDSLNKYEELVNTLGLATGKEVVTEIDLVDFDLDDYAEILSN